MNVRNVGNPSLRSHILSYMRENTQGRNPMSVRSVGKLLCKNQNLPHIRRHTQKETAEKYYVLGTSFGIHPLE